MSVLLADGRNLADITELISAPQLDYRVGQVSEMTIPAVDPGNVSFPTLLKAGAKLNYDGAVWDVAAVERDYRGEGVVLSFTARSQLARRLRLRTGPDSTGKITPADWIAQKVREEGGRALVQGGATRRKIVQKRGESVLDVITTLSGDMATEWTEWGNRLFVGTGWWALQGNPKLPTWPLGIRTEDCLGFQSRSSLDDKTQAATATVTLPYQFGNKLRPWHRMQIQGAATDDNGIWLIQDVSYTLHPSSTATVTLYRPLKSQVQKQGSSSSGEVDVTLGEPIAGSSYRDADIPRNWKGRGVQAIINLYRNNRGGLGHQIFNGCLWYAQEAAGYQHVGANPEVLWNALPTNRRYASKTIVPGAVVLYQSASSVGHAVVYLGGGKCLSTDMSESGAYTPGRWSIGPIDVMAKSFGCSLLGWYAP